MGMRVTIENTGDSTGEHSYTSAKAEFFDPSGVCTAARLGELIGYAINGMDSFIVPGSVLKGIRDTINSRHGDAK
tara:strand:+ start:358 stop:582 length:225 start_codon:yes stop_codon:yes gene_type:complete